MVVPEYGNDRCFLMKQKGHQGNTFDSNMVLNQSATLNILVEHDHIESFLVLMSL